MRIFGWHSAEVPVVTTAGEFPLAARGFAHQYLGPTHAIHLHQYKGRMRLGEEEIELAPGMLTVSPAGVASSYDLPKAGSHWCVHFMQGSGGAGDVKLPCVVRLGAAAGVGMERFSRLAALRSVVTQMGAGQAGTGRAVVDQSGAGRASLTGRGYAGVEQGGAALSGVLEGAALSVGVLDLILWVALTAQRGETRRATDHAVEEAAAIIDRSFDDPPGMGALAREVGLSPNYLARRFRERYGMTMPRYIIHRRVQRARDLLLVTGLPVYRVAEACGFADVQHLNKTMRRVLGVSPTGLRRSGGVGS